MSRLGPFDNAPQLVERKAGLIDMMVRDRAEVDRLQFYGARTLDAAYGKPTGSGMPGVGITQADAMFTVGRSQQYRSPSVVRRRWSWYGEALRGMSRVAWDPADYVGDTTTDLPSDTEYWFVRVQESRPTQGGFLVVNGAVDTGEPKLGPIYVVPHPEFFGQVIPTVMLAGTAPDGTGAVAGSVPPLDLDMQVPNPMHIILPRATSSITINNHDAANPLLVSTNPAAPMVTVGFDEDPLVVFGSFKEILVAGDGGPVPFSVQAVVALGADV
jgi:hypothetical protein